ncbi:MAG: histidinol-phosphatase [Inquilinaceae bacterium]
MTAACPDDLIALAGNLAEASGTVIRRHFRTPFAVDQKADASPVTIADRGAEQAMRAILARHRPRDGIVGEEFGAEREDAGLVWVLDPIDGTKSFVTGRPIFGTLIALLRDGVPILGVIDQPILGDRWVGAAGRQTVLNGREVRTRACPTLDQATLSATAPEQFATPAERAAHDRLRGQARIMTWGGDCYGFGLLAAGFVDLVVEAGLALYDFAALVPVVTGAGGVMTDWRGAPLGPASIGQVVAAGDPRAHDAALRALAGTAA